MMREIDPLTRSVVEVHGRLQGTGFFIGNDGSLLTCFHVVGEKKTREVHENLCVIFREQEYHAECIFVSPDPEKLDIAVLRLVDRKLPSEAILLPLGEWKTDVWLEDSFRTFGYRSAGKFKGLYAEGKIRGQILNTSGVQLLQLASETLGAEEVRKGMSGAPIYHKTTQQIVGIIALRIKETEETIPCAIPLQTISEYWLPLEDRLRKQELLRQLSLCLRIGQYFTETQFQSFYMMLPITLLPYGKLGEDKPGALLEQVRGQDLVYDFVNYLRNSQLGVPVEKLIDLPPVYRINFVNRQRELEKACGRYDDVVPYTLHYMIFDAPSGYGKTELLKAIGQQHFRDGWFCIFVETPPNITSAATLVDMIVAQAGYAHLLPFPDIQVAGNGLAVLLKERACSFGASGIVLLIDNVERFPEDQINIFVNIFLFALQNVLQNVKLRVRLAGRYIGPFWRKYTEFEQNIIALTPFELKYVKATVKSLLPFSPKISGLCAVHLMHTTGGHPGCMAKIIEDMECERCVEAHRVEEYFATHQQAHRDHVLSVADEIRQSIPGKLRKIFDVLSVFRRYNYRLLQKIIDAGLIDHKGGADSLEKVLTATYQINRKNGFIQDAIVRRLLAIRLRWKQRKKFIEFCEKAKEIYKHDLIDAINRPEFIAIEGLYQELQSDYYQGKETIDDRQALRDRFFAMNNGILYEYLELLSTKPDALDDLLTALEDENGDWEFRFAVNFFLRGTNQDNTQPDERMIMQIKTFITQKRGNTNG